MQFNNTNWNLYKSFVVTYEKRNLTAAAGDLCMSRSAVGQNIKELERQLGVVLFTPTRKGVDPTAEADNLFPDIKKSVAAIINAENGLQTFTSESTGTIKIAIPDQTFDYLIANYLREFYGKYPNVRLEVYRLVPAIIKTDNIDFVFDMDYKFAGQPLETVNLFYIHGNLIAHKGFLEKRGLAVNLSKEDFLKHPIIMYHDDPWVMAHEQSYSGEPSIIKTDSSNITLFLVKNQIGIGWYGKEQLEMLNDPELVEVNVEGFALPVLTVTCAYNKILSRPARAFLEGLLQFYKQ